MLNETQLRDLLRSSETHWIERKQSFDRQEVMEAMVAFANSIPENQHAVLFIGVGPTGNIKGVQNADEMQRKINGIGKECFPSLRCTPAVLQDGEKDIVAVVVEFSKERPHFAGAPFIRSGSQTIKDRQILKEVLEDLIASRNDKARRILRDKGQLVTTVWRGDGRNRRSKLNLVLGVPTKNELRKSPSIPEEFCELGRIRECRIERCDAHVLHLYEPQTSEHRSTSLEKVTIAHDDVRSRTMLIIDNR